METKLCLDVSVSGIMCTLSIPLCSARALIIRLHIRLFRLALRVKVYPGLFLSYPFFYLLR